MTGWEIDLTYLVPVVVSVDVESREVTRVVVADEMIWCPGRENAPQLDEVPPLGGDVEIDRAWAIAEAAMWPGWEFGW